MVRDPGFIKLWRSQLTHWTMRDPVAFTVWSYLLLSASYEACTVKILGEDIPLRPGQLVRSRGYICRDLDIDEDRVRRALRKLEKDGMIRTQGFKWGSLITIEAWGQYQKCAEISENPAPPSAPPSAPLSGEDAPNNPPPLNGCTSASSESSRQQPAPLSAPLSGEDAPNNPPTVKEFKKEEEEGTRMRAPKPPASANPEWPSLDALKRMLPDALVEYTQDIWAAAYAHCCTHHDGQRWVLPGTTRRVLDPRQHFLATLERVSRRSAFRPTNTIGLEKSIANLREQVRLHVGNPINGDSPMNHAQRPAYKALLAQLKAAEAQLQAASIPVPA